MYHQRFRRGITQTGRFSNLLPQERDRRQRWAAKGRVRVTHPDHGSVVVPNSSNFVALLNAAEVWGCDWLELRDAVIQGVDRSEPVSKMPIHYI